MAAIAAAVVVATALPASPIDHVEAAAPIFVDYMKPAPGPLGPISVIGDSVMLGSVLETDGYGPSVAQMLVERGWGPVSAKAGVGFQAGGNPGTNPGANMSIWVQAMRARGWDPPNYLISIGPNDIVSCSGSVSCAVNDITRLVDTIGPEKEILWTKITMPKQSDADAWNQALTIVASTHPNLSIWDWPNIRIANNIPLAADGFHLPTGAAYVARSRLMADDITSLLGAPKRLGSPETPPAPRGPLSEYVPVPLDRVFDSRELPARVAGGATVEVDLSSKIPSGATAVSVNLTAVGPDHAGFLTAFPCDGAPPSTSNVNFDTGQTRPNHVVVSVSADRKLCVFSSATGDVLVDLQGAFVPSGGLRLDTVTPTRLVDTRETGRADPLVVAMPAGAAGVVLNVTAVNGIAPGFVVAYPCDAPQIPKTSNLNFVTNDAVAGSVYAQVSAAGTVCFHSNVPVDIVVDLQGTLSTGGALRFQAAEPKRMLDTRSTIGGWRGQLGLGIRVDVVVAPTGVQAVTGNITMVQPGLDGFATAYECNDSMPATSSVNASRGTIAANSITTKSSSSLCIRSSVGAQVIFDTTGWWTS